MTDWTKSKWRSWAKETRAHLDIPVLGEAVVTQLGRWPLFREAERILTYLAFGAELDLAALCGNYPKKHFYATRVCKDHTLTVHKLTGKLERHPYGFLQPVAGPVVELGRLELLLIPGLAFDQTGNRLGYGKGFYDRLLARAQVPLVGVVPSELIVPALPIEPHDMKMTHLLSEKGVLGV